MIIGEDSPVSLSLKIFDEKPYGLLHLFLHFRYVRDSFDQSTNPSNL